MRPAEQIDQLKHLAGKDFRKDLGDVEGKILDVFEDRKDLKQQLKSMGDPMAVEKVAEVDIDDVLAELDKAEKFNAEQQRRERSLMVGRDRVKNLQDDVAALMANLKETKAQLAAAKKAADKLPEPKPLKDVSALKEQFQVANDQNIQHVKYMDYLKRVQQRDLLQEKVESATDLLEDLRCKRLDMMAGGRFPVKGISFVRDALVVNGIPFDQMASSEKIRVSARIGMAIDSELKIMFVRDGSLLDDNSFAELVGLAKKSGYQLWVETVGNGHGDAVVLKEGAIDPEGE
jgi:hypothetical protein